MPFASEILSPLSYDDNFLAHKNFSRFYFNEVIPAVATFNCKSISILYGLSLPDFNNHVQNSFQV